MSRRYETAQGRFPKREAPFLNKLKTDCELLRYFYLLTGGAVRLLPSLILPGLWSLTSALANSSKVSG